MVSFLVLDKLINQHLNSVEIRNDKQKVDAFIVELMVLANFAALSEIKID